MHYVKASLAMLCVIMCTLSARPPQRDGVVLGRIEFPHHITKVPDMKILYKGTIYDLEVDEINQAISHAASFQLTEDQACKELFVLITQDLKRPQENNFTGFKTSALKSYKLFRLRRYTFVKEDEDGEKHMYESWHIEEFHKIDGVIDVPDNTLIVLIDPQWVDHLQEVSVKKGGVLRLPSLCMVDSLTPKDIASIGVGMDVALFNLTPFHTRPAKRVLQVAHNHVISLNYNT